MSKNVATSAGGGLVAESADLVDNVVFQGNKVTNAAQSETGGGAVYAIGSIIVLESTISGNSLAVSGANEGGAGLFLNGSLEMLESTVSGNVMTGTLATNSGGGGVFLNSDTTITNSTIGQNASSLDGGGIYVGASATMVSQNMTAYENTASHHGGNIANFYSFDIANSIVAGGKAATGPDVYNAGTLTSSDYNIVQTAVAGTPLSGTTTHDKTVNPQLLALANNGGPTPTYADKATSPGTHYIPFANPESCGNVLAGIDQRTYSRGTGGHCDVGAYEYSGIGTALRHAPAPAVHRPASAQHRRGAVPRGLQVPWPPKPPAAFGLLNL
jgi:hypothetical protein